MYNIVEGEWGKTMESRFNFRGFGFEGRDGGLGFDITSSYGIGDFHIRVVGFNRVTDYDFLDIDIDLSDKNGNGKLDNVTWTIGGPIGSFNFQRNFASFAEILFYKTIMSPVMKEVISMWNALPAANRA